MQPLRLCGRRRSLSLRCQRQRPYSLTVQPVLVKVKTMYRFLKSAVLGVTIGGISLLSAAYPAVAAASTPVDVDPAEVIAYQGNVVLTQVEIDAAFSKLPPEDRLRFIRDGAKVDQLIRALLQRKTLAAEAVKAGFDQDALVAARVRLEADLELGQAWMQQVMSQMPDADYETLAHEDYLGNPEKYRSEVVLDVSHILISTDERGVDKARELARSVAAMLQADPARFDDLVAEYSDDPAKVNNGGRYHEMRRGMMVKPFEEVAFALQEAGAISGLVQTDYGFHIIRLNGRSGGELQEYNAVKAAAVEAAREQHAQRYRENYLQRILAEKIVVPDAAVEIMARRHFGEDLELAPGRSQ